MVNVNGPVSSQSESARCRQPGAAEARQKRKGKILIKSFSSRARWQCRVLLCNLFLKRTLGLQHLVGGGDEAHDVMEL